MKERRGKECVESGETRNRTLLLNIEKRNIYIYVCIYIYIMEWRATFLGRDWEEFLSLSPFGNAVFSYADLGRARERKRGCLSLSAPSVNGEELQFLAGLITGRIITRDTTASLSRLASVRL